MERMHLLGALAALGLSASIAQAVTPVANMTDLKTAWTTRGGTGSGLLDSAGNPAWTVGWVEHSNGYSDLWPAAMKQWGYPDSGGPAAAYGWSHNGLHDSGWAVDFVGFEVSTADDSTNPQFRARTNGPSAPALKWTSPAAGTYTINFAVLGAFVGNDWTTPTSTAYATGIYSSASDSWIGDSSRNPENGTAAGGAFSTSIPSHTMGAGDYLMFVFDSNVGGSVSNLSGAFSELNIALAPEPATLSLLAFGSLFLARRRRV